MGNPYISGCRWNDNLFPPTLRLNRRAVLTVRVLIGRGGGHSPTNDRLLLCTADPAPPVSDSIVIV